MTTTTTTPGEDKSKKFARFIVSFVIAFMAAVYYQIGSWMSDFFAHGSILIIIIIMMIILMGMFGLNPIDFSKKAMNHKKYSIPIFIFFALGVWWIAGMICANGVGQTITVCNSHQDSFLAQAGFPTLQGIFPGIFGGGYGGGSGDIWNNDLVVALMVIGILALLIYGLWEIMNTPNKKTS